MVAPLEQAGIPVTCFGATQAADVWVLPKLVSALRRQQPRLLQTYLFHANLLGRIAGRIAGVPHIVSGIRVAEQRSAWYLRLDRWTERWVDRHVCVSQAVARHAAQNARLSPEKLVVIPNGVDSETFARAVRIDLTDLGIPEEAFTFLTVGRLDPQKGLFDLLPAFEQVHEKYSDAHLLIVGQGSEQSGLEAWIREHHLTQNIHLAGYRADVPRLMKSAQAFVLASRWEGMPNVLLEAMAANLSVISTQVEGVEELILPEKTGLLVPTGSVEGLSAAMQQMITNRVAAEAMAVVAAQKVQAEFTWERSISQYEALYRSLLQDRNRALETRF